MSITKSTRDSIIEEKFKDEEDLLRRFDYIKKVANAADAERDRLREYIRDHIPSGRYGKATLGFRETSERIYANSEGNFQLEHGFIAVIDDARAPLKPDTVYKLHHDGKVVATLTQLDNTDLYTKKGSITITLVLED